MSLCEEIRLEVDLDNSKNLIQNPSGEFRKAGWRNWYVPTDRNNTNGTNERNGSFDVVTTGTPEAGPVFRGVPAGTSPVHAKYYHQFVAVQPGWFYSYMVDVWSPVGGSSLAVCALYLFDADLNFIADRSTSLAITPGAPGFVTIRGMGAAMPHNARYAQLRVHNIDTPVTGRTLYFKRAAVFGGPDSAVVAANTYAQANEWTNILHDVTRIEITRGNQEDGITDRLNIGTLVVESLDPALDPAQTSALANGQRIRVVHNGLSAFVGRIEHVKVNYTEDGPRINMRATDVVSELATSTAPVLRDGDEIQRMYEVLGPYSTVSADSISGTYSDALNVNKKLLTMDDSLKKVEALEIIRNGTIGINSTGALWVDRGGNLRMYPGGFNLPDVQPISFGTREPVSDPNGALSDFKTNFTHAPDPDGEWVCTAPTDTRSCHPTNSPRVFAATGKTVTMQATVKATQAVRVIPQVVLFSGTVIAGTPVDIIQGSRHTFIWNRVATSTDATDGFSFRFKFENFGGGTLSLVGEYARVRDPLCMEGTWSTPQQAFTGSMRGATWVDNPYFPAAFPGSGDYSRLDFSSTHRCIVKDGFDLSYDSAAITNSVTVVGKVGSRPLSFGPFDAKASVDRWGRYSGEFVVNSGIPYDIAQSVLNMNATPTKFPTRIVWNATERLDEMIKLDVNSTFSVFHDHFLYECRVLALTHVITPKSWLTTITPKRYAPKVEVVTMTMPPVAEMPYGPGTTALTALSVGDQALGTVGGQAVGGTGNLGAAITTTETMPTNMHSGTLNLLPKRRYKIHCRVKYINSVAGDRFLLRLKHGATSGTGGTVFREHTADTRFSGLNMVDEFVAEFETGDTVTTKVFSLTVQRSTGTGNMQVVGGGLGDAKSGVWVEDIGPAGVVTFLSS